MVIEMQGNVAKKTCRITIGHTLGGSVATPLWDKCEDETHTPKSGKLKSSGTLENSKLEFKSQNTLH
jgi:hypothetical protein